MFFYIFPVWYIFFSVKTRKSFLTIKSLAPFFCKYRLHSCVTFRTYLVFLQSSFWSQTSPQGKIKAVGRLSRDNCTPWVELHWKHHLLKMDSFPQSNWGTVETSSDYEQKPSFSVISVCYIISRKINYMFIFRAYSTLSTIYY